LLGQGLNVFERLFPIVALLAQAILSANALCAPTATVALDTELSGCEFGRLLVTTAGISGGRQFWRATTEDFQTHESAILGEGEGSGPATGYSGGLEFPFLTGPIPYGIVVKLYGYQGSTPPTPATTAEFSVTYVCDTLEILAIGAGPYGTITAVSPTADIPALSTYALLAVVLLIGMIGAAALGGRAPQ